MQICIRIAAVTTENRDGHELREQNSAAVHGLKRSCASVWGFCGRGNHERRGAGWRAGHGRAGACAPAQHQSGPGHYGPGPPQLPVADGLLAGAGTRPVPGSVVITALDRARCDARLPADRARETGLAGTGWPVAVTAGSARSCEAACARGRCARPVMGGVTLEVRGSLGGYRLGEIREVREHPVSLSPDPVV